MDDWKNIFFIFYFNIPCMKCEKSCHILKIIYHGLISAFFQYGRLEKHSSVCGSPGRGSSLSAMTCVRRHFRS